MLKRLICLLFASALLFLNVPVYAAGAATDTGHLGNDQWHVQSDGDLVPDSDSAYDIGASGTEVDNIYADSIWVGGSEYTSFAAGTDGNWSDTGLTLTLDQAPTAFILTYSTGVMAATGFSAGTADVVLENAQILDGGTNGTIKLTEASDSLSFIFSGTTIQLDSSDGGFQFGMTSASEGYVDFLTNNDTDDYIRISTVANVPTIVTAGTSNLELAPDGGTVVVTGALTSTGLTTAAGLTTSTTITLQNSETIVNSTNNTVEVGGGTNTILSVYDAGTSDSDATLQLSSDAAADNGDVWQVQADGGTQDLLIRNNATGSQATWLTIADTTGLITTAGDLVVAGTTPLITVGDAGNEDAGILINGQTTSDFYISADNADDSLIIGYGSTVGTDNRIQIDDDANNTKIVIGDGASYDHYLVLDGASAADYYIAYDHTGGLASTCLTLGVGSAVGTTPVLGIDASSNLLLADKEYITNATDIIGIWADDAAATVKLVGFEASASSLQLMADQDDDATDAFQISATATGNLTFGNDSSVAGTFVTKLTLSNAGVLTLADSETITNASDVVTIGGDDAAASLSLLGFEANVASIQLNSDQDDDATDGWQILGADSATGILTIGNDSTAAGTYIAKMTIDSTGAATIQGSEAAASSLALWADNGDDAADKFTLSMSAANALTMTTGVTQAVSIATTGVSTLAAATITGTLTASGAIVAGYEMVTTTAADPGLGTAAITKLYTAITSDATGASADVVSLAAGAAGQMKFIRLAVDGETTGTSISADYYGATAAALMEDAGDVLILISDGTEWHILLNTGCTLS